MNVLTIGSAMHDTIIEHKGLDSLYLNTRNVGQAFLILEEGRKLEVEGIGHYVGGGAANSATSFARLGNKTQCFFKTGDDPDRQLIMQRLEKEGIELHAAMTKKAFTGNSFVLPCSSGNRTTLVSRGANLHLEINEIPESAFEWCDIVYITSLSQATAKLLPEIAKRAKAHNKLVATNPGSNQLEYASDTVVAALPSIDIFILNAFEAQILMSSLRKTIIEKTIHPKELGVKNVPELLREPMTPATVCFTLHQFFREILSHGPQTVVVTNGAEGVYAAHGSTIYFQPSVPATVLSTLGAGDAFGSTFVSELYNAIYAQTQPKNQSQNQLDSHLMTSALLAGAINSASILAYPDAQTGLLTRSKLIERQNNLQSSHAQVFPL